MHHLATIAALATSISTVSAVGNAFVKNHCSFPVSLWAVDAQRVPQSPTIIPPGGSYSEPYHTPSAGGVSLKLSLGNSLYNNDPITQFEYTLSGGFIWYDGSNVNCAVENCPFYPFGVFMQTTDPACPQRTCQPNQKCDGFYNLFNDDWNSLACGPSADIQMYLCSTSANGPAPAAPAQSSPAALPNPVANAVVVSSAAPSASTSPIYRMEALHVPVTTLKKIKARETDLAVHFRMRRHAHGHQH